MRTKQATFHTLFRFAFLVVLFSWYIQGNVVFAQRESYPKNYFLFPINPGQKNTLAGVLGDLRTNHFHAGIDVRTQQREGLEVLASADGYISKIRVQTNGYGNVIFLKHPNGMSTVYGHLLSFAEPFGSFVRQKQYERQTFEIDFDFDEKQFPVKKGQFIALSGNTGGSQGPHLHFEIRDSKDNYLNPLFFGFTEVEDDIPPYFNSLAIKPMSLMGRVNGEFERTSFRPIRQKDGSYSLSQPVRGWGELGVELVAFDAMNGVNFRNGINCVEIKLDGQEVFAYNMTSFPSRSTRDYNQLIDYATEQRSGVRYLKCYNPDGNEFNLYQTNGYRGKLMITDTLEHQVEVRLFDSYENASVLRFTIKGEIPQAPLMPLGEPELPPQFAYIKTDATENILKISALGLRELVPAELFVKNKVVSLNPAYQANSETVYLLDMRQYLPDSIQIGNKVLRTHYRAKILPNRLETYKDDRTIVRFGNQSVFDTLYLAVQTYPSGLMVGDVYTPLRDAIGISFKPQNLPENIEKTHAYRTHNGRMYFLGGNWQGNQIEFTSRDFGNFMLATDTEPPKVQLLSSNKNSISARIHDAMSGIKDFKAYVNGQWVLMNYDYKRNYIWSEKLVDSTDFEGTLRLEVTDRAGNTATIESEIKEVVKVPATRPKKQKNIRAKSSGKKVPPKKGKGKRR